MTSGKGIQDKLTDAKVEDAVFKVRLDSFEKELKEIKPCLQQLLERKKETENINKFVEKHKDGIVWAEETKGQSEKLKVKVAGMLIVSFVGWVAYTIYTPFLSWLSKFKL